MLHRDATFKKHVVMISFSILSCMKKIFNIKTFSATKVVVHKKNFMRCTFFLSGQLKLCAIKKILHPKNDLYERHRLPSEKIVHQNIVSLSKPIVAVSFF